MPVSMRDVAITAGDLADPFAAFQQGHDRAIQDANKALQAQEFETASGKALGMAEATGGGAVGALSAINQYTFGASILVNFGLAKAENDLKKRYQAAGLKVEDVPAQEGQPRAWKVTGPTGPLTINPREHTSGHARSLGELYADLSGKFGEWMFGQKEMVQYTPAMRLGYDLGQFAGLTKIAKAPAGAVVAQLPKVAGKAGVAAMKPIGEALTVGTADVLQQLDKAFREGDSFDWGEFGLLTAGGAGVGTAQQIAKVLKGRYILAKALQVDDTPLKMLSKKDQALFVSMMQGKAEASPAIKYPSEKLYTAATRDRFNLNIKAWQDVYQKDYERIMKQVVENARETGAYQGVEKNLSKALLGTGETGLVVPYKPEPVTWTSKNVSDLVTLEDWGNAAADLTGTPRPKRWVFTPVEKYGSKMARTVMPGFDFIEVYYPKNADQDVIKQSILHELAHVKGPQDWVSDEFGTDYVEHGPKWKQRFSSFKNQVDKEALRLKQSTLTLDQYLAETAGIEKQAAVKQGASNAKDLSKRLGLYKDIPVVSPGETPLVTPPPAPPKRLTGEVPKPERPAKYVKQKPQPYDRPEQFDTMSIVKWITPKPRVLQQEGIYNALQPLEADAIKMRIAGDPLKALVRSVMKNAKGFDIKPGPGIPLSTEGEGTGTNWPWQHKLLWALHTEETAPSYLNKFDRSTFLQLRTLTKYALQLQNEHRAAVGRPLIPDIGSYYPLFRKQVISDILQQKKDMTPDVARIARNMPKGIFDPMAMQRKLDPQREAELAVDGYFENNPEKALVTMIDYAMKDVYLNDDYALVNDKMTELRNIGYMPEKVYKDYETYVRLNILGHKHWFDADVDDAIVKTGGMVRAVPGSDKVLNAIGKYFKNEGGSAIQALSKFTRSAFVQASMSLPRQAIRNLLQPLLDSSFFPVKDVVVSKAMRMSQMKLPSGRSLEEALNEVDWYGKITRNVTELQEDMKSRIFNAPLWMQKVSQNWDYNQTLKVAYLDAMRKYEASQVRGHPWNQAVREAAWKDVLLEVPLAKEQYARKMAAKVSGQIASLKQKVGTGELSPKQEKRLKLLMAQEGKIIKRAEKLFNTNEYIRLNVDRRTNEMLVKNDEDVLNMLHNAVRNSEFEYMLSSMPWIYNSQASRMALVGNSYFMNMYRGYFHEITHRTLTGRETGDALTKVNVAGRNIYRGMSGRPLWPGQRWQGMLGLGINIAAYTAIEQLLGVKMLANLFPYPMVRVSPVLQAGKGLVDMINAQIEQDPAAGAAAWKEFQMSYKAMVPFIGPLHELNKLAEGDLKSFLAYPTKAEQKRFKESKTWKD